MACQCVNLEDGCHLEYIVVRMASRALKHLGEKAFQSLKVGDIWHKPAISAKGLAKLRKQTLAEGRYHHIDISRDENVSTNPLFIQCCLPSAVTGRLIKTCQLGLLVFLER